jgi:hypothetical protein
VALTLGSYPDLALAAARSKVADHRKTIAADEDPRRLQREERKKAAREQELSFDEFADRYIDEYAKPNKKSWKNDVGYPKRPREERGRLPAASITDDDVANLLDRIAENALVSVNGALSILHKMFEWVMQPGRKYVPSNPLAGLERLARECSMRTKRCRARDLPGRGQCGFDSRPQQRLRRQPQRDYRVSWKSRSLVG